MASAEGSSKFAGAPLAGAGEGVAGASDVVFEAGAGAAGAAGVCAEAGAGVEGAAFVDEEAAGAPFGFEVVRSMSPMSRLEGVVPWKSCRL